MAKNSLTVNFRSVWHQKSIILKCLHPNISSCVHKNIYGAYPRSTRDILYHMADTKPSLAACEYKTGRTLGQGSYGVVKEGIKIQTGEKYAIKVISKKLMRGREGIVMNEINILKRISKGHKNIVTLVDYFESPNNRMRR
jgi:serine/threonine protein kinase